jgi:hypothetical protein
LGTKFKYKRGRKEERCGVRDLQSTKLLYSVIIFIKPKGLNFLTELAVNSGQELLTLTKKGCNTAENCGTVFR